MKLKILAFFVFLCFSCKQMPKNICDCVDESYRIQKKYEKKTDEASKKEMEKETKILSKHCRRLRWRGSTCTADEVVIIMKKHYGDKGTMWDLGAPLVWMNLYHTADAEIELDFVSHLKGYLNRIDLNDSTQTVFPRMWDNDSTERK